MTVPALDIEKICIEEGMLIVAAGANVVRFVPPLVITKENVDEAITILKKAIVKLS